MKGPEGLLDNFAYYYDRIMERQSLSFLMAFQRNSLYEEFLMAQAFYTSAMRESGLTPENRTDIQEKYERLQILVNRIRQGAGDIDLRAV